MSPGTQLLVRTNFDKQAAKITYELKFYQQFVQNSDSIVNPTSTYTNSPYCLNTTIKISQDGLLTTSPLKQTQLKYLQECTATLLVTILMNSESASAKHLKQQTLVYTIRVKPIIYAMLKLNRNSMLKVSESVKFKLTRQNLIKNRLELNSAGIQMKWHVRYYDNLGDMFDVVNTKNIYALNRNDLIDFSNLNANLFGFSLSQTNADSEFEETDAQSTSSSTKSPSSTSNLANAVENSFTLRTISKGVFIMELTPWAVSLRDSRDYIGITMGGDFESTELDSVEGRSRVEANIGDLICLSRQTDTDSIEDNYDG